MFVLIKVLLVSLLIHSCVESRYSEHHREHGHTSENDHDHGRHHDDQHYDGHDIENGNLVDNVVDTDDANVAAMDLKAGTSSQTGQEVHAFAGQDTPGGIPGIGAVNLLGNLGVMPEVQAVASTSWATTGSTSSSTVSSTNNNKNSLIHDDAADVETKDGLDIGHHHHDHDAHSHDHDHW